jgi:hypothetical protein
MAKEEAVKRVEGEGFTLVNDGKKLVIEVDLANNAGVSGSGKSIMIATSAGNMDVGDGIKMGLNIYRKK